MALAVDFEPGSTPEGKVPDNQRASAGERSSARIILAIENMNCGGCMRKIERVLDETAGIDTVRANLSAKRVTVEFNPRQTDTEGVIAILSDAGFRAADLAHNDLDDHARADRDLLLRLAVAGFAAMNIMLLSVSVWAGLASDMDHELRVMFHWLSALIALPTVAYSGQPFFRSALTALKAWRLNMDVPISLALLLAAGMSLTQTIRGTEHVYFDASVSLIFFLLIGRYLDQSLRSRAKGAAQNLLGLKSGWATVRNEDGSSERLPARAILPGMRILVATGERIPADGRIVSGTTDIDEQLITGETLPRTATKDAAVYAGTLSLTAPIEIEATAADDDTLLSEIARLMETAEQNKGRYVRLADKAAALYAPLVHALGLITFLAWMFLGAGWETALITAISVLIITCPCALALAVPAVQVAATSRLFKHGVLMTSADGLERLSEIDTIVLDKTGTLTRGEPQLTNSGEISNETLAAAARLAAASRHPYARALVNEAKIRNLPIQPAQNVSETPGSGLLLDNADGTQERLGSATWCGVPRPTEQSTEARASLWYRSGKHKPVAFHFVDKLRSDAAATIAKANAAGLEVILLSGDRCSAVADAAEAAGITKWYGEQRPDQKIAHLEQLKAEGRRVLMVGDGLNDAPALATAHASLSPSSAAEVSQIASDGIIQGPHLAPVIETLAVARKTRRMSLQNFAIAAAYNAICIPLAMAGFVTPLIATIAMSASSILVTSNALRLTNTPLELS
ncbi:MAG: heavy metal translocating P-type ATPase [Alphaproteobacteria bacterium]|nr:heavy metal translocating P-type ATPase [Alphaproteobacteria bacterium]